MAVEMSTCVAVIMGEMVHMGVMEETNVGVKDIKGVRTTDFRVAVGVESKSTVGVGMGAS